MWPTLKPALPDFEELCQSYDIVCLVDSRLFSLDSFDIQNFEILHLFNRKKNLNQDLVGLQSWLRLPFLNMLRF